MRKDRLHVPPPPPLFETKAAKGRMAYWSYAASVVVGIVLVCYYRASQLPSLLTQGEGGEGKLKRWGWIGLFMAELWYSLYWMITQSLRSSPVYRYTFKDRLSQRYEKMLPSIDIFVCTADHEIEPPLMVINTVLSLMAYDYPPEKLNVYLSDDGCSELMFYALLEASRFSRHWLPFSKRFSIHPRSPAVYFSTFTTTEIQTQTPLLHLHQGEDDDEEEEDLLLPKHYFLSIQKLYAEMKKRIEETVKLGRLSDEQRKQHKSFAEWDMVSSKRDHHPILQILIDGRDSDNTDVEGKPLPTLVYIAREKRPHYHHNFKAGAMNALIRVSSKISNSPVILNVDCDMYSNNSESVRDALCFLLDEERGHEIAYIQFPQHFYNITANDLYSNSLKVISEVEFPGIDANGGPLYVGSGCFHRRDVLCGKKFSKESPIDWKQQDNQRVKEDARVLEETSKILASCSCENDTQWGKEMGLKYGCPVEDVITGLSIQCRGWKSVNYDPERKGFLGVAPTTLLQTLIQHKRWSEGDLQIFLSKYCPFLYGHGKIPLKLQVSYCCYLLWAANSLATLYFVTIPPLCLIRGISLFPQLSSLWILPYAYVSIASYVYSFGEFLYSGGTTKGWWNDQRMWLYKRVTSYLFGFLDTIFKLTGVAKSGFAITTKVADEEVSYRYKQEIMEFGAPSPMFNILATIALFNLFTLVGITGRAIRDPQGTALDLLGLQMILSGLVVIINLPLYEGLFFRKDKGRMPSSITCQSLVLATLAYSLAVY